MEIDSSQRGKSDLRKRSKVPWVPSFRCRSKAQALDHRPSKARRHCCGERGMVRTLTRKRKRVGSLDCHVVGPARKSAKCQSSLLTQARQPGSGVIWSGSCVCLRTASTTVITLTSAAKFSTARSTSVSSHTGRDVHGVGQHKRRAAAEQLDETRLPDKHFRGPISIHRYERPRQCESVLSRQLAQKH